MPTSPRSAGAAFDAAANAAMAEVGKVRDDVLDYLITIADEAEAAVVTIEEQLDGWKASLTAKRAEAKKARAAADAAKAANAGKDN